MKRKILVPMFASVMALSMSTVANADEVENKQVENKEENSNSTVDLGEYKEVSYKVAVVKDGVAVKIREEGNVQHIAYTGDEFKVIAIQGEWVEVVVGDGQGWLPARYVDVKEAKGFVTSNKVNFRKEATVESEIVEELEIGSRVTVIEEEGNWIKVKRGEEEGYIRSLYVSEEAPVIEEEQPVVEENQPVVEGNNNNSVNNSQTSNNNASSNNNTSSNSNSNNTSSNSGQTNKPTQKPSQESNDSYNPPSANTSVAQAVVNLAYAKIGSPYVWGAEGPNSFDCSGLTSYVYRNAAGISLPRTSSAQGSFGQTVSKSNLQPGDLVFFNTNGKGISHVGIYVGGGQMVHAPSSGKNVTTANINSSYYSSKFVTAKRVL